MLKLICRFAFKIHFGRAGSQGGPKGLPRGLKEAPRKALWEALGLPWDRLGPTWDRFRIVLRSFLDHLGIFLESFGDHLEVTFSIFRNSVLELTLQLYGPPGGRHLC